MKFTLRTRLIIAIVLMAVVPLIIISVINYYRAKSDTNNLVQERLSSLREASHGIVSTFMDERNREAMDIARVIASMETGDLCDHGRLPRVHVQVQDGLPGRHLLFRHERVCRRGGRPGIPRESRRHQGQAVLHNPDERQGRPGNRDGHSRRSGNPVLLIVYPVKKGGTTNGVLIYQVNMKYLSDLLGEYISLGETGEVYLIDASTGLMISESRFVDELKKEGLDQGERHP